MAPVQSRPSRSRLGLGLAACGGVAATTLFVAPSAPPRAAPLDVPAVAATASSGPRPWAGFASEAGLALAAVGIAGMRRGAAQSTALAATAVVTPESPEAEAPLPPPFNPASQVGAMEPLGFFDPMGFTKVGDEDGFRNLREAELKHGRVAMMASIGLLAQHYVKLPGFESAPAGFAALSSGEGVLGFVLIFAASGILELAWRSDPSREPGNFGDPFGVNMYTEEMRTKEISNGRMAMISVLGIFAAELASGKDAIQQFGLSAVGGRPTTRATASTFAGRSNRSQSSMRVARAAVAVAEVPEEAPLPPFNPAEQVGAMEPLGYFDPLGFTKVGDEDGFRNLREAELKHGRVAMMASIGLVFQHFVKFPFFENAPSGLAAMASGEGVLGFVLLFAVSGILELAWRADPSREPGNFGDPFGVNMYTEEMRLKEISNGRMAMISVLGIFAAELATGKDAIQQFGL